MHMKRGAHFSNRIWPLAGFFAALIAGSLSMFSELVASADHRILDTHFRWAREISPNVVHDDPVIVGINESFLDAIDEPLALSHVYLSRFLQAMDQAGPKVVGLDLVLPEKRFDSIASTRDEQLDFHKTLLKGLLQGIRNYPLIAAKVWDQDRGHYRHIQTDYAAVLGMQSGRHQALASAIFCPDSDRRIRRYPGKECQPDHSGISLASEVGAAYGIRKDWSGLINYRLGGEFQYIPIQDVLKLSGAGNVARLRQLFEGKVVLLGTVFDDADLLELPVALAQWRHENRRIPGVLAHAQVIRTMLNDAFIQPVPFYWILPLCALFALLWFGESVLVKFPLLVTAGAGLFVLSGVLLRQGWWLPPGAIGITGLLAFGGRSLLQGWRHYRDKQRLHSMFSGSVSPAVMKALLDGGLDASRQSRKLSVCVLFADIRNFTTLCEGMSAEDVVGLLNRYFARMAAVVHRHGGTVDKFIGDGLMAFFGAPNELAVPEQNALDAARDMLRALEELNREFAAEGRAPLRIGVGLHCGEAVIGQVGSSERHEYTAIGDTVNTASRIEGLCKEVGYPIVCSARVAEAVGYPAMLVALGERPLKGHSPVPIYGCSSDAGHA